MLVNIIKYGWALVLALFCLYVFWPVIAFFIVIMGILIFITMFLRLINYVAKLYR